MSRVVLLALILACRPDRVPVGDRSDESAPDISPPPLAAPVNLLLVTVDTLRADHLGSYGYPRRTSPALDRLAAEGTTFERVFAPRGLTWPSLTSLHTSLYPQRHGVRDNGQWLRAGHASLATVLRDAGFATAAFLTNMTNAAHAGFEVKEAFPVDMLGTGTERPTDALATEAALGWLEAHREQRFFLWLHLLAPHAGYQPPALWRGVFTGGDASAGAAEALWRITSDRRDLSEAELAHIHGLYDGEVAYNDQLLDALLRTLAELGIERRTLVVFTADHGEELYERHHYFFHKCSVYDAVLRVPLVLRLPPLVPAGRRVAQVVTTVDIAPTVLELLGLEAPAAFEGRSRAALTTARGAGAASRDDAASGMAFSELGEDIASVRTARWRYVYNPKLAALPVDHGGGPASCYPILAEELYDLEGTGSEQRNVVAEHPEVAERLRRAVIAWRRSARRDGTPAPATLDDETQAELRALGYLR